MTHNIWKLWVDGPLPSSNIFLRPPAFDEPVLHPVRPAAAPPGLGSLHPLLISESSKGQIMFWKLSQIERNDEKEKTSEEWKCYELEAK